MAVLCSNKLLLLALSYLISNWLLSVSVDFQLTSCEAIPDGKVRPAAPLSRSVAFLSVCSLILFFLHSSARFFSHWRFWAWWNRWSHRRPRSEWRKKPSSAFPPGLVCVSCIYYIYSMLKRSHTANLKWAHVKLLYDVQYIYQYIVGMKANCQ